MVLRPNAGHGLLNLEVFLITHDDASQSVGLPLDEWSARRRDLYLTTHNTHNRQTSMPPVGFEPTISVGERQQTYALDRAATGTGNCRHIAWRKCWLNCTLFHFLLCYGCPNQIYLFIQQWQLEIQSETRLEMVYAGTLFTVKISHGFTVHA